MKRVKTVCCLLLCMCTAAVFTACLETHRHTYGAWETSDTQHWKECECGEKIDIAEHTYGAWETSDAQHWKECECGEKIDVAEHDYDEGKVTTEATAEHDGVKTFTCKICNTTKTEIVEYVEPPIVLTEETDFEMLEGESITEAQWKAAFDDALYENATIKIAFKQFGQDTTTVKITSEWLALIPDETSEDAVLYTKLSDSEFLMISKTPEWLGITIHRENGVYEWESSTWKNINALWRLSGFCPIFSAFFDRFAYDEAAKAYVLAGDPIEAGAIGEPGAKATYNSAMIKIVNGKLAYMRLTLEDLESEAVITFYDLGTTEVDVPEWEPQLR
ncbi:MAG: hypothetical protein HFK10_08460 [Clostridia bacterium]|jgi:hypothetical protein|nr:hypothetical protein [Clostridia bacterium]